MNLLKICLESERLILKPVDEKYIDDINKNFTEKITTYMYPQPNGVEGVKQFVEESKKYLEEGTTLQLVILDKITEEFLGCAGIHNINRNNPELGIWIKQSAHYNGYGYEAISFLIKWGRDNLNIDYFRYPVDRNNYPSRIIPERHNGILKKEYKKINMKGKELDILEYWIYNN